MKLEELFISRAKPNERDRAFDPKLSLYLVTIDRGSGSPYTKIKNTLDTLGTRIDAIKQASFLLSEKKARDIQAAILSTRLPGSASIARVFVGKIQAGWSFKIPDPVARGELQDALRQVGLKFN